jgi:hypothetical protein
LTRTHDRDDQAFYGLKNKRMSSGGASSADRTADGVIGIDALEPSAPVPRTVFTHYNGPPRSSGRARDGRPRPGSTPHPPHQHPEEEFYVARHASEIECAGKITPVDQGR